MKTFWNRVKIVSIVVALFTPLVIKAQNESDLVKYVQGGTADGSKLIGAYLAPVIEGLSYGLNTGWYTTAKAHSPLGVDLSFSLSPVLVPKSKDYFDPASLSFQTINSFSNDTEPSKKEAPTFFGPDDQTTYYLNVAGQPASFNGPQGLNIRNTIHVAPVIMPMVQLGIGLIKGTDLKIRYLPDVKAGHTHLKMIGFGILHDIKQYIPGIKLLPFDLSVMAAYTKFQGTTDMSGTFDGSNQVGSYNFGAFLLEGLISKKIAIVTFYGGLGYDGIKTDAAISGTYTYSLKEIPGSSFTVTDPFKQTYKNKSARFDLGARLNLAAFYIDGQFTAQEYSSYTLGLGFTFR